MGGEGAADLLKILKLGAIPMMEPENLTFEIQRIKEKHTPNLNLQPK